MADKNFIAGYGWTAVLPSNSSPETEIAEIVAILPRLAGSFPEFMAKYRLTPLSKGGEHDVYITAEKLVIKVTQRMTGFTFGIETHENPEKDRLSLANATPRQYLKRIFRASVAFNDGSRIMGYVPKENGCPVIVHEQANAGGRDATVKQIESYMHERGFRRISPSAIVEGLVIQESTYYNAGANTLVGDCRPPNFRVSENGKIMPIDVLITKPEGRMLTLCKSQQIMLPTDVPSRAVAIETENFMDALQACRDGADPAAALDKLFEGLQGPEASKKQLHAAAELFLFGDTAALSRQLAQAHFQKIAAFREDGLDVPIPPRGCPPPAKRRIAG
jgi:hypothetical protein